MRTTCKTASLYLPHLLYYSIPSYSFKLPVLASTKSIYCFICCPLFFNLLRIVCIWPWFSLTSFSFPPIHSSSLSLFCNLIIIRSSWNWTLIYINKIKLLLIVWDSLASDYFFTFLKFISTRIACDLCAVPLFEFSWSSPYVVWPLEMLLFSCLCSCCNWKYWEQRNNFLNSSSCI